LHNKVISQSELEAINPNDVDVIGMQGSTLTKEEEKAISEYIRLRKNRT